MKKIILFTFSILFSFSFASAQQRNCGTMQHLQYLKGNDLQLENKMIQNEIALQSWIQTQAAFNSMNSTIITIPVVVHVVYYNSTENISTAQVQSQIDILNEDFRRLNADASNTPSIFQAVAADTEIEFCLATTDPNGNSTTGITRTSTTQTSFSTNDGVKYSSSGGVNAWNTAKYLNIWVCDISGGILGYAQFPGGPSSSDGIVCDYAYFGNIGTATSPYDLGRTATHEVGHWLNLRHIWGDSNCGNDYCNDTPIHNTSNYGCPSYPHLSTCSGTPIEMTMNYMDYTYDACMNMFSQNQKTRMIAAINTSRSGLLTSNGCQGIVYSCTVTAASSSPALCINSALTPNITHTTTVATGIGAATGLPAGVSALFTGTATSGTITISGTPTVSGVFNYSIPLTGCTPQLFATGNITVNPLPTVSLTSGGASITTASVCVGSTLQLYGTATAATTNAWISATPAKATINVSTGLVTGVAAGTSVITYKNSNGCTKTVTVTVNSLPTVSLTSGGASITTASVCVGSTLQLYGTATAATTNAWLSANPAKATINVSTGLVTGVAAGTSVITYTNSNGCTRTVTVTVNPQPNVSLTSGGASITTASVCVGSTLQLYGTASAATSNAWTSSATAVATINNTGLVTGVSVGTTTITYKNSNGCTVTTIFNIDPIGCTDSTANNYDPNAVCDDGSCIATFFGCTDPLACNYNPSVTIDDGNCAYPTTSTTTVTACDSYTWNGTTYAASGTYSYTIAGDTSFSSSGTVSLLSYCPSNPAPSLNNQLATIIANVQLTGDNFNISNNTAGVNDFYQNYTSTMYADITEGQSYSVNITPGNMGAAAYNPQAVNVYIDFNIDGDFTDAGEDLGVINITWGTWVTGTVYPFIVTVPSTGVYGATRMRVVCLSNANAAAVVMGPCISPTGVNQPYFGATEDYSIVLNSPSASICDSTVILNLTINLAGCTDASAFNYDPNAVCDNGSCTFTTTCLGTAPLTGVFVDGIIDTRATFNWDNMNTAVCDVDQLLFRYREVGTSAWLSKTLGQPLGTTTTYATSKTVLGLLPATTYEYQCKIWYAGVSAPVNFPANPSGTFTTLGVCPNVTNLTVTTPTTTKATFTWDASNGVYSFVRLKSRPEMANPQATDWFNIGGTGVAYGTFTKSKSGLTPGASYRAQARTYCDPNGGGYRSNSWTPLVYWTQPTIRLEGGESIANLEVYPNPSKDVFNITFTSETVQNLKLRVLNIVGEEIILEDLQQFVGEYTKSIDLATYTKGVYFLEITTNNGVVNKKLILQ